MKENHSVNDDSSRLDFSLDNLESSSALWLKLKEQLEWQLKCLRERNDNVDMNATETAYLRGQIKQIKDFLTLDIDRKAINDDE